MRLVFVNSHHDAFHWLTVVFLKMVSFTIAAPLSAYLGALGFVLSQETIQSFLPSPWLKQANFYLTYLPYFLIIKKFVLNSLSYWYANALVWWTMVVGIPLMALGASILLINFFNLYYALVSGEYNRTHCLFCRSKTR